MIRRPGKQRVIFVKGCASKRERAKRDRKKKKRIVYRPSLCPALVKSVCVTRVYEREKREDDCKNKGRLPPVPFTHLGAVGLLIARKKKPARVGGSSEQLTGCDLRHVYTFLLFLHPVQPAPTDSRAPSACLPIGRPKKAQWPTTRCASGLAATIYRTRPTRCASSSPSERRAATLPLIFLPSFLPSCRDTRAM